MIPCDEIGSPTFEGIFAEFRKVSKIKGNCKLAADLKVQKVTRYKIYLPKFGCRFEFNELARHVQFAAIGFLKSSSGLFLLGVDI